MRSLVIVFLLLAVVGCTKPPVPTVFESNLVYERDFDAVWTAVIEAFADNSWSIDNMEKDSGFIATDWMSGNNRSPVLADCGKDLYGAAEGVLGEILLKFNVFVKSVSGGTEMRVNCTFKTPPDRGGKTCLSKGTLEARLMDTVAVKLGTQ